MRLIDADRFLYVLEKNFGHTEGAQMVKQMIEWSPTVETESVRHGELRGVDDDDEYTDEPCYDYECSVCGDRIHFGESTEKISVRASFSYCPNCGALIDWNNDERQG